MASELAEEIKAETEFASLSTTAIQVRIDFSEKMVNRSAWGTFADDAVGLLARHWLIVFDLDDTGDDFAAGPVSSEKIGPLSRSYSVPAELQDSLASTRYGATYLRIRRTRFAGRVV